MNLGRVLTSDRPESSGGAGPGEPGGLAPGVEGNARLTGAAGAVLFFVLAVETLTLLQIHQLISWHVFLGLLLVPLVLLKTATTGYRFTKYYRGDPPYRRKGPPIAILRLTGPLLVLSTFVLLGTGIALVALGRNVGHQYLWLHKTTFFVWAALIAIHVLGHLRETPALAVADWRERWRDAREHRVEGAELRFGILVATLAVGVVLGIVSLGWVGSWHNFMHDLGRFGHG
jgi:hypothetical protein